MQGVEMKFLQAIGPEELDQELVENPRDALSTSATSAMISSRASRRWSSATGSAARK
jgi:hypothetical protein